MMKLYDVPNNTRVRVIEPDTTPPGGISAEPKEYLFHHIDGLYSFCVDDDSNVVHLPVWQEVEVII